mmetsp:Transcript_45339/g.142642  ORF Transcript_45339/g.142642 Transcript_45339/m.142642 type:complete len:157 (-) Transcript_45339:123-593(-)
MHSAQEVLQMEVVILHALKFNLTAVTPHNFLTRLCSLLNHDQQTKHLCEYLTEITIQEFQYLKYRPSVIAASAVCLGMHTLRKDSLHPMFLQVLSMWRIELGELAECVRELHGTHVRIANKTRTLQASSDKFAHSKLSRASSIPPQPSLPAMLDHL